jgi:hypothetical protein
VTTVVNLNLAAPKRQQADEFAAAADATDGIIHSLACSIAADLPRPMRKPVCDPSGPSYT